MPYCSAVLLQHIRYVSMQHIHACVLYIAVLVQMGGVTFLTDPVFAQRCSASQWVGPKRYTKPAMQLNELPSIDFVLLSHNHYDHLCTDSVKAIGNNPLWIVPEGLKQVRICLRGVLPALS
jgi:L-ascorbate metabolism protein UlaG (beta-lactamase superfamily)